MAIVDDIKCARCDRKYSGVRSRCPYCGARRIGLGKYAKDTDNAKGKMLIAILILSVFTVAAGVMLFTTPTEEEIVQTPEVPVPSEDDTLNLPGLQPIEPETPTPTPETPEPVLTIESVQIWVPRSHRVTDFTQPKSAGSIELTAVIDPPGIDVQPIWDSTNDPNDPSFTIEEVVGGIKIIPQKHGDETLILIVGDIEERCVVRIRE